MNTTLVIRIVRENVAKKFNKAIYVTKEVNRTFASYADACKFFNLRNCCYEYVDENGEVIKRVNNIAYPYAW